MRSIDDYPVELLITLATLMGAATSRLGVVATMSTLGYPPFLLARLASTVDHLTGNFDSSGALLDIDGR